MCLLSTAKTGVAEIRNAKTESMISNVRKVVGPNYETDEGVYW